MSLGFNWEVFVVKSSRLDFMSGSVVRRTARRGPFLREARALKNAPLRTKTVTVILQSPKRTTGSA